MVGIVTLVLFALWGMFRIVSLTLKVCERNCANICVAETFAPLEQPFLPTKLLRNVNYVAVCVAASVGTMIYFSLNVLWPQQIAALYTTDPIKAGWLAVSRVHPSGKHAGKWHADTTFSVRLDPLLPSDRYSRVFL